MFQVEKDKLIMKLESARSGKSWEEVDTDSIQVLVASWCQPSMVSVYVFLASLIYA